jgi:hypothetical protein
MSLKSFHVVFVTVCTLLFAFLTIWSFLICEEQSSLVRSLGYVGIAGLLMMPFYGVYFLRKSKAIHL